MRSNAYFGSRTARSVSPSWAPTSRKTFNASRDLVPGRLVDVLREVIWEQVDGDGSEPVRLRRGAHDRRRLGDERRRRVDDQERPLVAVFVPRTDREEPERAE